MTMNQFIMHRVTRFMTLDELSFENAGQTIHSIHYYVNMSAAFVYSNMSSPLISTAS